MTAAVRKTRWMCLAVEQTADCGSGPWAAILVNVHRIDRTRDSRIPCMLKKYRQIRSSGKRQRTSGYDRRDWCDNASDTLLEVRRCILI
jgi:hypothetical protein